MKKLIIAAVLIVATSSAYANPVHLTCETLSPNNTAVTYQLTLNEGASTVVLNTGVSRQLTAQFSQTSVLFNHPIAGIYTMNYELNRVDGTLITYVNPSQAARANGSCAKAKVVERKF